MRVRHLVPLMSMLAAGCSTGMSNLERDVKDLRATVDDLRQSVIASRQRVEDLDNRLLLLQDQVETQKIATGRGSRAPEPTVAMRELPVVKVLPQPEDDFAAVDTREAGPSRGLQEVVYQRIDGEGKLVSGRSRPASEPAPAPAMPREPRAKPVEPAAPPPAAARDDSAVLDEYKAAYDMYQQGRVEDAMKAFAEFVASHPRHPYADNSQYWIGECLYDQRRYEEARREFVRVIKEHPDGNKVPDAMLKVGLCDRMQRRYDEARRMFDAVMLTYPETDAATRAMKLVGELP